MSGSRSGSVLGQFHSLFGRGTLNGMSEALLLERFVAHKDEEAFEALIARHGPMVLGICRRMLDDPRDVEDAFQATFLVLVRKAGSLRDRDLLANWLYGVAHRVATRARAAARRRRLRERPGGREEVAVARQPREDQSASAVHAIASEAASSVAE
jgi:RNA polymerase sigma factor (sigma-70 family)